MEKLPVEVHTLIAAQSRVTGEIVSPVLFETLIIEADEWGIWELDWRPYESLKEKSFDCLHLVRHFRIWAHFHRELEHRCPHSVFPGEQYAWEDNGVDVLGIEILPLLNQLKPRALRSFRWDLGSCVPKSVLGIDGYLQREQPEMESLSLNTGASTDRSYNGNYNIRPPAPLMLDSFRRLRSFSWTGARLAPELESLRVLAANRDILETLELDFIHRSEINNACNTGQARDDPRVFTTHILPLSPDPSINSFPALTTLSLSAVCLPTNLDATVSAFDFGQLRVLKLHRCKNTHLLLRGIVQAAQSLKLETLELQMDDFQAEQDLGGSSLTAFLRSFNGLRQLYLLITPFGVVTTEQYFESILCHAATMKRLVYHERTPIRSAIFRASEDKNLTFATLDSGYGSTGALHRFMQQSSLESLGCCDSLSQLRKSLEPYSSRQSLKMFHIRCSDNDCKPSIRNNMIKWTVNGVVEPVGTENYSAQAIADFELFDFVRWAFGSRGLPKLQVLAFGDLSYHGRHKGKYLLFCRQRIGSPHGFRLASGENVISLSGVDGPFDFLGACPKDPLYPEFRRALED